MALTDNGNGLSAADVAAVMHGGGGGNGFGFGDNGFVWLLILFLFAFMGGGWGNGVGNCGSYPYAVNNIDGAMQRGFDQSAVMAGINGLSAAVQNGFSDAAVSQCNQTTTLLQGMNTGQMAMLTGFNGLQNQMSNDRFDVTTAMITAANNLQNTMMANETARQVCCCDTKQAIGDLKYTVATENCADRAELSNGIRDVIAAQNANTQALLTNQTQGIQTILDKMNQQEMEALKTQYANLQTQNANLQTQLNMQSLAAGLSAQTSQILQDNNAQTATLIQRIAPYPVPSYTVGNPYAGTACCNWNGCCGQA